MASINKKTRKNGSIAWQVQIRIAGNPSVSKSFDTEEDAKCFARTVEEKARLIAGKPNYLSDGSFYQERFSAVMQDYLKQNPQGSIRKHDITVILRHVGDVKMGEVKPSFIKKYINTLQQTPTKNGRPYKIVSISKQLSAMSVIYKWRAVDFDIIPPEGLFSGRQLPRGWNQGRERRLSDAEYQTLMKAIDKPARKTREHWKLLVDLALETGARLQELVLAEWLEFDLAQFVWTIPRLHTKNKKTRYVPLSERAFEIIQRLIELKSSTSPRLFHCFKNPNSVSASFHLIVKGSQLADFKFHDLRHEAISRMVIYCRDVTIYEIMKIVGHSSIEMLHQYANLRPQEVVSRFRTSSRPFFGSPPPY
jgi:integrase